MIWCCDTFIDVTCRSTLPIQCHASYICTRCATVYVWYQHCAEHIIGFQRWDVVFMCGCGDSAVRCQSDFEKCTINVRYEVCLLRPPHMFVLDVWWFVLWIVHNPLCIVNIEFALWSRIRTCSSYSWALSTQWNSGIVYCRRHDWMWCRFAPVSTCRVIISIRWCCTITWFRNRCDVVLYFVCIVRVSMLFSSEIYKMMSIAMTNDWWHRSCHCSHLIFSASCGKEMWSLCFIAG